MQNYGEGVNKFFMVDNAVKCSKLGSVDFALKPDEPVRFSMVQETVLQVRL